jgi:hypothetical protein
MDPQRIGVLAPLPFVEATKSFMLERCSRDLHLAVHV